MEMQSLLEEMQQCKTVKACIELVLTDAYGEYEQASAWLTCIEEMFARFDRVKLMGEEVSLQGFDLENELTVVVVCKKARRLARADRIDAVTATTGDQRNDKSRVIVEGWRSAFRRTQRCDD